jgi:Uncharacterized protein conserved in bacteria (DUF2188)
MDDLKKRKRSVLTVYNGRAWVNILEGKGPFRGSFASRDSAVVVGRAHAADSKTIHVIHDENGAIVETKSYERLADFSQLFDTPIGDVQGVTDSAQYDAPLKELENLSA